MVLGLNLSGIARSSLSLVQSCECRCRACNCGTVWMVVVTPVIVVRCGLECQMTTNPLALLCSCLPCVQVDMIQRMIDLLEESLESSTEDFKLTITDIVDDIEVRGCGRECSGVVGWCWGWADRHRR